MKIRTTDELRTLLAFHGIVAGDDVHIDAERLACCEADIRRCYPHLSEQEQADLAAYTALCHVNHRENAPEPTPPQEHGPAAAAAPSASSIPERAAFDRGVWLRWAVIVLLLLVLCIRGNAQSGKTLIIQGQNAGSTLVTRAGGLLSFNCAGGLVCTYSNNVFTMTGGAGSGGITTLNTLTGATQTFATGTSGSDFGISSSGTTHTFHIPTASASVRGLLSSANWSTFNSKLGITGSPTLNAIFKGDGTGAVPSGCLIDNSDNMSCPGTITSGSAATGGFRMTGSTSGSTVLMTVSPTTAAGTLTVPGGLTDMMVARTSTDTLTNKTLTTPTIADFTNATHSHTTAAAGGVLGFLPGGMPPIPGATIVSAFSGATPLGTTDLYTAPASTRALLITSFFFNGAGGTINGSLKLKNSGTYYRLTSDFAAAGTSSVNTAVIVLNPGQSLAVTTDAAGLNIWLKFLIYPDSGGPFSPQLLTLASGDNTIYTVTTGKTAIVLDASGGLLQTAGRALYTNVTGTARSVKYFVVPSGGTTGVSNSASGVIAASNNALTGTGIPAIMASQSFAVINTDASTAGQVVWLNVFEQ